MKWSETACPEASPVFKISIKYLNADIGMNGIP